MKNDADIAAVQAWTAIATAYRQALEHIESALKSAGFPQLAWYDALLEIERSGDEGIRPFQLRQRLLLPQYGTSRLLDRMVQGGLIERSSAPEDGRGHVLRLTSKGRTIRQQMWPVYRRALREVFADDADPAVLAQLATQVRALQHKD